MEKNDICKLILQQIKDYITNPDCLEAHREPNHFVRKRKLSMLQVILYLFYSSKASMYQNLAAIRLDLPTISFPEVTKQALSKARQGISPRLFMELYHISVDSFYQNYPERKTWNGFHLFAIDGSKFELPNSPSNFEFFGEMFGHPDPSRKFTAGLASVVYDVLEDYIVHASFQRYLAPERAAALEHLANLEALHIYEQSIVIFDRGYYSEDMFRYCIAHDHFCVMRLKDVLKISKACRGDSILTLPGDPKTGTEDIPIRVIEVTLDDGSKEYLATNIPKQRLSTDYFKELYFKRWPVETKYLELKKYLQIESFNGATTTSIFQEFYLNLLLSNLVALVKNNADKLIDTNMKQATKYRYQANRSFLIGQLKYLIPRFLANIAEITVFDDLLQLALKCRSQIQPGRSFRRKKNRAIGRTHFRNKKPAF